MAICSQSHKTRKVRSKAKKVYLENRHYGLDILARTNTPFSLVFKKTNIQLILKNQAHLNRGGHDCGRSFENEVANIAEDAVVSMFLWHLVQI